MKKIITLSITLLLMASGAFAGKITSDSTWDEIRADKTLKVVFPVIAVEGGAFATYDEFHMEGDMLKSGKTWEKSTDWEFVGDDMSVTKTETQKLETPVNYTYIEYVGRVTDSDGHESGNYRLERLKGVHSKTVRASVYKRSANEDQEDTFLFSKAFTIPSK